MATDPRHPIKNYDTDTEDRLLPAENYRYGLNGRSGTSDKDGVGTVEGIRGNSLVGSKINDNEIVIGSAPDTKNNAVVEFVCNKVAGTQETLTYTSAAMVNVSKIAIIGPSIPIKVGMSLSVGQFGGGFSAFTALVTGYGGSNTWNLGVYIGTANLNSVVSISINYTNYIKRYYNATGATEFLTNPVLMSSVLGWVPTTRIYNPKVIDAGYASFLAWTDPVPRLMNIDKMKYGGDYFSVAADSQYINLKKVPPIKPPTISYVNTGNKSNVVDKFFQFRYRFLFSDKSYSEFSPISKLSLTPNNVTYDAIGVTYNSGHHTVVKIEIAYREGNGISETGTVNPDWYIFHVADKSEDSLSDDTNYTVNFTNSLSRVIKTVARVDSDKLFDTVPELADQIEVVNTEAFGDQIVLGSYTEGEDNVEMDCSATQSLYGKSISWSIEQFSSTVQKAHLELITQKPEVGDTLELVIKNRDSIYFDITSGMLTNWPLDLYTAIKSDVEATQAGLLTMSCAGAGSPILFTWTIAANGDRLLLFQSTFRNNKQLVPVKCWMDTGVVYPKDFPLGGIGKYLGYITTSIDEAHGSIENKDVTFDLSGSHTVYASVFTNSINGINICKFSLSPFTLNVVFGVGTPLVSMKTLLIVNSVVAYASTTTTSGTSPFTYSPPTFYYPIKKGDAICVVFKVNAVSGSTINFGGSSLLKIEICSPSTYPINTYISGFKKGVTYSVGVIYYKNTLIQGGVNDAVDVYFPTLNESTDQATIITDNSGKGYFQKLLLTINNLPPDWATQYGIVLKRNVSFGQGVVTNVIYGEKLKIVIDTLAGYSPSAGDKVQVVGYITGNNIVMAATSPVVTYVEGVTSLGEITLKDNIAGVFKGLVVEVSRENDSPLYFENGQFADIVGGYHMAPSGFSSPEQNQTNSQPCKLYIDGDIWFRERITNDYEYLIESEQINDTSDDLWDKGRPQVKTPTALRLKYPNMVRWGNQLIPNTQVNGLSTWDEGNVFQCGATFGAITGLRQIGYTLDIVQETNISKTFLGRKQIQNADGSQQLVVTDNLISIINPSEKLLGTKHPGSIVLMGENLYYIDTLKGKAIRSAQNGEFEISDYFMKKYWRDLSALIESSSDYEVISGVDYKYKDVYWTVKNMNVEGFYENTIYFNEDQNAWKYNVGMRDADGNVIDWYGYVGQSFFTFMNGDAWLQNSLLDGGNPKYLNLFGHDKSLVIETIGMIEYDKVKIFLTHAIHANIAPTLVEFWVPPNEMYPNGMYSYLKPGNYKYREGVFYADIKKDWFTKGIPADPAAGNLQVAEGRPLRGHVVKVRLTYTTNDYVKLFSTTIGMIPSEKS